MREGVEDLCGELPLLEVVEEGVEEDEVLAGVADSIGAASWVLGAMFHACRAAGAPPPSSTWGSKGVVVYLVEVVLVLVSRSSTVPWCSRSQVGRGPRSRWSTGSWPRPSWCGGERGSPWRWWRWSCW